MRSDIRLSLTGCEVFPLADGEADIHRILADDDGQHTAIGIDDIALGDVGLANLSRDRRRYIGIAEVDFRGRQVGLVAHQLPVGLLIGGQGLVSRDNGSGILVEQFLRPPQLKLGQDLGRLASLDCGLGYSDRRLEQSFLDTVERRAFLDQVAFLEEDLLEISRHTRPDLHTLDGLHATDKHAGPGNGLALRGNRANSDGRRRSLLRMGGRIDVKKMANAPIRWQINAIAKRCMILLRDKRPIL